MTEIIELLQAWIGAGLEESSQKARSWEIRGTSTDPVAILLRLSSLVSGQENEMSISRCVPLQQVQSAHFNRLLDEARFAIGMLAREGG